MSTDQMQILLERLDRRLGHLEAELTALVRGQQTDGWFSVEEFAAVVKRTPYTVRKWCREGSIRSQKKLSGRGPHAAWSIPHAELERYEREGLLPARR
jgi:hypothetical protein